MLKSVSMRLMAVAIACSFLIACGGSETEEKEENKIENENPTDNNGDETADSELLDYFQHNPLMIAHMLKNSGLEFETELTHSTDNLSNYTTRISRYLGYGIYSSDLAFCVLNEQPQQATQYIKAIRSLSDDLGFSTIFDDEGLISTFENNMGNRDSMLHVITQVQENLEDYVMENEQEFMHAVIFSGGWIEFMYFGAKVANNDSELSMKLVEQMTILNNLIVGLSLNPDKDEMVTHLIGEFKSIMDIYANFASIKALESIDDADFNSISITDDELEQLKSKIMDIRDQMIKA
jgi:hypothetical protein